MTAAIEELVAHEAKKCARLKRTDKRTNSTDHDLYYAFSMDYSRSAFLQSMLAALKASN